ncbi:MAG: OmpA family protein [Cytophagaceae bacterium]|nr:OmpA family protein [Cytophagaceae bacterium]
MKSNIFWATILKALILVIISSGISLGQAKLYKANKKKELKRTYHCKHVGVQKIKNKKYKKHDAVSGTISRITIDNNYLDTFALSEVKTEEFTLKFNTEINKVEENLASEVNMPLPKPVYFRFDTDELTYEDLDQIILAIEHIKLGKTIVIEGHTDSHGSIEYNRVLSLQRAIKIKKMMIELGGVNADAISIEYHGEEKPAVANDTAENRQLNRRVEFIVQ